MNRRPRGAVRQKQSRPAEAQLPFPKGGCHSLRLLKAWPLVTSEAGRGQ
jgi:hypothetical protein